MVAKSVRWALAGLIVSPSAALALGLGDIHLLSTLNAPLNADIELVGATPDELSSLTPRIASRETFAQHGLDWPAFLSNVTVRAEHTNDGRDIIKLHSTEPVTEPFLTLLVELDWDRGHFVREYTVLLDPPVYTPNAGQVAHQPIEAPTSGATPHGGAIERSPGGTAAPGAASGSGSAQSSETATAGQGASGSAGAASGGPSAGGTYEVRRGDTLTRIAAKLGGGGRADEQRWMVAAFQANPGAFEHNINLLRSGAVLRIPSASAVEAVSAAQASAEVHRQYAAWRGGAAHANAAAGEESGRLRLVAPGQAGAGSAGTAGTGAAASDVKSLQGEVKSLQAQLDESRRLLDMRNAELAQLQSKLAARESAAAAISAAPSAAPASARSGAPTAATSTSSAAPETPAAPASATTPAPSSSSAESASVASASAPAAAQSQAQHKPPRRPAAPAAHPAAGGSWLDALGSFGWLIGIAVAALVGLFGYRVWSSRRKAGFDDSLGRLAEAGAEAPVGAGLAGAAHDREPAFPETAPQMAPKRESSFLVEESGTHERPRFESPDAGAPATRHVESDDSISSETAINLDQGDPLAEADFHMAYGLYDQAADLVRIAIQRDPQRRDLKLKLLEVFFVWGNREQFLNTARELADTRAQAAPGEWEKVVIMGKQLAPDDPLFAGGAAVSGAAAGGVDLDLEGGQDRIDFDVMGEQPAEAGADAVDLDIGSALGERDPAAEAAAHLATDKNLALDDSMVLPEDSTVEREAATATRQMTGVDAGTGSTREMTARTHELAGITREMTATLERDVTWDSEEAAPTVEQPALSSPDNPTIRQKVEMALRAGAGEHTTELAIDDLGLDLTALAEAPGAAAEGSHETVDQPAFGSAPDAPTLVAGLDEHSRRVMETAERRATAGGDLKMTETGTWHFDADPLAAADATEATGRNVAIAADRLSETSRLAGLESGSLDFEVGDPHSVAAHANGGVEFDVGTATVPDSGFAATQRIGAEDLALPDLDPVTMSEVGTKLDLARAYMDMGDPEGARNILEEVLTEGSAAQKQEAERLISSLPG